MAQARQERAVEAALYLDGGSWGLYLCAKGEGSLHAALWYRVFLFYFCLILIDIPLTAVSTESTGPQRPAFRSRRCFDCG